MRGTEYGHNPSLGSQYQRYHPASTVTGSFPRPRWLDVRVGRPLDTCMLDGRFREKVPGGAGRGDQHQEPRGPGYPEPRRFHGDRTCGPRWHHDPLRGWAASKGDHLQPRRPPTPWLRYQRGNILKEM